MADRREFLLSSTTFIAGLMVARSVAAQSPKTALNITHAVTALSYIQSYVADGKGFLSDNGISAKFIDTAGGGPDVQLVLGGRAEATVNDGAQVFPALQQGQKLVCVLSLLDRAIVNATISKATADRLKITASTPIKEKLSLLRGLKIGVTRPGALTWQIARFNLASAGLNPDTDAQVIGIGGAAALGAALENGAVDVIYISMPIGEKLVQEGRAVSFIDNAKGEDAFLPNFMMEGLWVTPEYLAGNRKTVQSLVTAYKQASDFIRTAAPTDIVAALKPALGSLGEAVLLDSVARIKPAVSATGRVGVAEFNTTQTVLRQNGFLSKTFELGDVFDPSFLGT